MPISCHVLSLADHVQVPLAFKTIRVQPCSLGSIRSEDNTTCTACGILTFSLNSSSMTCDACPSGAQCNGSAAFIPPVQYYHSSPYSTIIVSCPNPSACGGDRTKLLECKLVSADCMTMQSDFHICHCSFACCLAQVRMPSTLRTAPEAICTAIMLCTVR